MPKRCPEDFNPWPPFVDIFASVILVMLLFLLITIVNIGYYAQFKFKTSYTASVVTKEPIVSEEQSKVTTTQPECKPVPIKEDAIPEDKAFSFHKVIAPAFEEAKTHSLAEARQTEARLVTQPTKSKKSSRIRNLLKKILFSLLNLKIRRFF